MSENQEIRNNQHQEDEERKERKDSSNSQNEQSADTAANSKLSQRKFSDDRFSKEVAIIQVCKERKKESFNQLKAWDDKRKDFLNSHKNVIDSILFKVEKRMKMSQDSMGQIVKFFKERKEQEQSYSKVFSTKVPHVSQCWKEVADPQNQEKSQQPQQQEWYPALSHALKGTDEVNELISKNILTLVLYLEKNIIKDLLQHENDEFEKKIKQLRGNIFDSQQRFEKATIHAIRKHQSYIQLYNMMMGGQEFAEKLKMQRKDLLHVEVKFRQAAFEQVQEQKELGQQILTFWEESRKLENIRLETVQKVFSLYLNKHQETYGKHPLMQQTILDFGKFDCLKETGEHFSIARIISQDDQTLMKKTINSSTLTWQDIQKYVINFNFKDICINQHPLVQKKFKILRDVGSITKSFRECWMVATVDDILLFYDEIEGKDKDKKKGTALTEGGEKVNNHAKKKFLLDFLKVKQRDDPQYIDIIETTPGLLFSSTTKQLIKFKKDDDFMEFKVFLTRYQNNAIIGQPDNLQRSQSSQQ